MASESLYYGKTWRHFLAIPLARVCCDFNSSQLRRCEFGRPRLFFGYDTIIAYCWTTSPNCTTQYYSTINCSWKESVVYVTSRRIFSSMYSKLFCRNSTFFSSTRTSSVRTSSCGKERKINTAHFIKSLFYGNYNALISSFLLYIACSRLPPKPLKCTKT